MSVDGKKRRELLKTLLHLAVKQPEKPIEVPEGVQGFGMIVKKQNRYGNCLACQKCVDICEDDAIHLKNAFNIGDFLQLTSDQIENAPAKKKEYYKLLKKLQMKEPDSLVDVPEDMSSFGEIEVVATNCIACNKCVEICPEQLLEKLDLFDLPSVFSELKELH